MTAAETEVLGHLASYVWGRNDDTWSDAIGRRLAAAGWSLATYESGTGGSLIGLLGDVTWLRRAEVMALDDGTAERGTEPTRARLAERERCGHERPGRPARSPSRRLEYLAGWVREAAGCAVGLAVEAVPHGKDLTVRVAVVTPDGTASERRLAFMGGPQGRLRAGLTAAAILLAHLPPEDAAAADA